MLYAQTKKLIFLALLLVSTNQTMAAPRSEAFVGQPFGVGRVTVDVFRGEPSLPLSDERFTVIEAEGRAIYPVLKEEPARRILRRLLKVETPRSVTIYYLFRGNEPFDLLPFTPNEQAVRVNPQTNERGHRRLLDEWWKQYSEHWQRLQSDPQYPPIAENFLVATFARRLNLTIPKNKKSILPWKNQKQSSAFDELFVSESYQLRVDRQMLADGDSEASQMQPLPEPNPWSPLAVSQNALADIPIEPIAAHVPEECFYIRFGNFANYFWFRDLNKKWQGDLGNMISRRGIDRGAAKRIEQQLSVRESAFAKLLGPQVIADAAIIGLDPYLGQGAAIGILFQAKNSFLISNDLINQRRAALKKFDDAEESTLELAGQKVSLVATPDGRVRSYYARTGDFHLVTTSRRLAERFLEAGQGERSLADLPSFRNVRRQLPVDREDTLFAFVSEKFFQNLCSPHYWTETRRRVQSARQPHLLELAKHVASTEGIVATTSDELISAGVLPSGFATRIDGSELTETDSGWLDSQRGAVGYFLPVADMRVEEVSSKEATAFNKHLARYQADIGQMPPIAVSIKRVPNDQGETLTVDALLMPIAGLKLGKLKESLGEPSDQQLAPVAGDVVSAQAVLNISVPLLGGKKQPHLLFGALQDFRSPLVVQRGAVVPGAAPAELVRGYLGAWPQPGLLQMFAGSTPPAGEKPEQANGEIWQAKSDEFFLLSFKPDVVEQVLPQLAFEPAERPAQIRLKIEDLTGKQLAQTVNAFGYKRARETSVAASRLMNALANQLQVPRDECRAFAERLVDGQFVCPLGGEYQLFAPDLGLETWASTALPTGNRHLLTEVPEDFQLPLLTWFRGLQGDLVLDEQSLRVHLEIKMTDAAVP
ncbi:MAG: hypothetical protein GXP28_03965 [Planctomycetes bacterium]|nr:hypothetical protein [Planctomycetota bacterium]